MMDDGSVSFNQLGSDENVSEEKLLTKRYSSIYFFSAVEIQTIMSKQGESINNEELKEIIREADLDGDGYINFQGRKL
jgi:calmodulin